MMFVLAAISTAVSFALTALIGTFLIPGAQAAEGRAVH